MFCCAHVLSQELVGYTIGPPCVRYTIVNTDLKVRYCNNACTEFESCPLTGRKFVNSRELSEHTKIVIKIQEKILT